MNQAKIKYAIVGGYAVALHGAVRGTVDLDLVLSLTEEAFSGAERVFLGLGLESRLPVGAKQIFQFREEYIKNRKLVAWSFYDPVRPANQLDVIITTDFRDLKSETFDIQGTSVRIVSLESLIEMKTKAGRPQDLEDVTALRALKGVRGHGKK